VKHGPLVSVIMIFLNEEKYIEEAIESVLRQDYPSWELILVDDGSNDGSSAIAREYARSSGGRIVYCHHDEHENRGMGPSRNLGFLKARGEYMTFLDADDLWVEGALRTQVGLLESCPRAGMVYGPTLYWHSWTNLPEDAARDFVYRTGLQPGTVMEPPDLFMRLISHTAAVPCMSSLLVRRETVDLVGGFEDRFTGLFEDQAFYAKISLSAPVLVSGEVLDWYRQHAESSCAVAEKENRVRDATMNYLAWLSEYLAARGLRGSDAWRLVQIETWNQAHPLLSRVLKTLKVSVVVVRSRPRRMLSALRSR